MKRIKKETMAIFKRSVGLTAYCIAFFMVGLFLAKLILER